MINPLRSAYRHFVNLFPSTSRRVQMRGHRAYTGGTDSEMWYGIGKLQYHFLISQGLRHDHMFLDVACGGLRLGQYLIPYLDKGHYFGLDAEPSLVERAVEAEFYHGLIALKEPKFAFNTEFDLSFVDSFDMAIAQSLFTHLTTDDIALCFANLRAKAHSGSVFFFTFFEGDARSNPAGASHANKNWSYRFNDLVPLAKTWTLDYFGDWSHPRNQMMVRATPKES